MASRLDKLYELLESNNPSIRSAAAMQIGQISGNCQQQLHSLLNKLIPYVKHKNWSTRIAAADALKHIGKYTKLWIPNGFKSNMCEEANQLISIEKLNLLDILKIGTRLYSTDIKELEGEEMDPSVNKTEINKHLGLLLFNNNDVVKDFAMVNNDDFTAYVSIKDESKVSVEEAVDNSMRRRGIKRSHSMNDIIVEPEKKVLCSTKKEETEIKVMDNLWPWMDFCTDLLHCLWHPKWEIRHGAATALREVIRSQGTVMIDKSAINVCRTEFDRCHTMFMEDVVSRILCTLALDQLSDFVNDEMVAPVRESCAQCLGLITVHLSPETVLTVTRHLLVLLGHSEWTVTHGALLGLKYVLAARLDSLGASLLPVVYGPICEHLRDSRDDDVRCAAAAALMPIFYRGKELPVAMDQRESLRADLWTVLALRADYTSPGATGAVLQLLEKLYDPPGHVVMSTTVLPDHADVAASLNRLHWCYYNYGEQVRLAAVRTCAAIVRCYRDCLDDITPATMLQVLAQLYQRVLIDDSVQVVAEVETLWRTIVEQVSPGRLALCCAERLDLWLCCAMQPARLGYAPDCLLLPENEDLADVANDSKHQLPFEFFIGGRESFLMGGSSSLRASAVLGARLAACRCLAALCQRLATVSSLDGHILGVLMTQTHLKERLALQRFVAASVLSHWNVTDAWTDARLETVAPLRHQLLAALEDPIYYQELLPQFREMIKCCRQLLAVYRDRGIITPVTGNGASAANTVINLAQCQSLVTEQIYQRLHEQDVQAETEQVFSCAKTSVDLCALEHGQLTRLVEVSLARAILAWHWLPQRLTPLIKPLMDTVRTDGRLLLQREAAKALAQLIVDCRAVPAVRGAIGKLVRNLVTSLSESLDRGAGSGICPGDMSPMDGRTTDDLGTMEDLDQDQVRLRGTRMALEEVCLRRRTASFTGDADDAVDVLTDVLMTQPIQDLPLDIETGTTLASLRAMETCVPLLRHDGRCVTMWLEYALCLLRHGLGHRDSRLRQWSARVLATLAVPSSAVTDTRQIVLTQNLMDTIIFGHVLPALDDDQGNYDEHNRQGAIETVLLVLKQGLLDYRLALVVPLLPSVLRSLNSAIDTVRQTATQAFAVLLSLLPLEMHGADPGLLTAHRQQQRLSSRHFIDGLLRPDSIADYDVSRYIRPSLRHYQQMGINWLSFLNRYGLHGVLADDMGLGKTLQTLSIIVGETVHATNPDADRSIGDVATKDGQETAAALSPACSETLTIHPSPALPKSSKADSPFIPVTISARPSSIGSSPSARATQTSLVVCPSSLTGHWLKEVTKHVSWPSFTAVIYGGSADTRHALLPTLARHSLVITSYDTLRADIDRLKRPSRSSQWLYAVLDEGHLVRNHKSKLAIAVKTIVARHRLVLTGTPIQNRVAELWSLFEFLMPGLLGAQTDFQRRYGRPLSQANSASGRRVDSEAGTMALESLHKRVLPFMLRRVKDDVLGELPAKILQDYPCTMTPVQARLYSLFSEPETDVRGGGGEDRRHIFQALHYLRQVCNHPSLVLTGSHPLHKTITQELTAAGQTIDESDLSGKLVALRQLLMDCGLGSTTNDDGGEDGCATMDVAGGHRVLVFCQSRAMMSLVARMISGKMPQVSFLTMDGAVAPSRRQSLVDQFNDDPSIDVMLLTTGVGGLGLNLTAADTVVFVEHDWNPMKDLQAMDRAHRIGQRRTVNVYRLLTTDSIEERIMNLQQFKMSVAAGVVGGQDNKSLTTMATDNLLDLMNTGNDGKDESGTSDDHCHDGDYGDEYDLENFVRQL